MTNIRSNLFLVLIILIGINYNVFPQEEQRNFKVVYLSPLPGSVYNLPETNIIVSVSSLLDANDLFDNVRFIVEGSRSGLHEGRFIISDDRKTFIFKPETDFAEDEIVNVRMHGRLKSLSGEFINTLSFQFQTGEKTYLTAAQLKNIEDLENQEARPLNYQIKNSFVNGKNLEAAQGGLPADFPQVDIKVSNNPDPDKLFMGITSGNNPYIMILDNNGRPVYYKRTPSGTYDFTVQPNGLLTYYDMGSSYFYAMDSTYALVDSFKCENGYDTDIHELRILPNGHALLIGHDVRTVDLSHIVSGGSVKATVIGNVIQELDKNKNVVFQWLSLDHFNLKDTYYELTQNTIDFSHANAIDFDDDGNMLVSFRNLQEITKINRQTGHIIWRLGGKGNQFTFINDTLGFSWQHAVRKLPNGDIIMFDNGCKRLPAIMSFSRAVEYKLNTQLKTAELVWQFRNTPDVYSIGLGYAQRLKNGNTLICWGAAFPTITEVRPNGTKAFEMSFRENIYTYRAYRFPWKLNFDGKLLFSASGNDYNPLALGDTSSFNLVIKNNNTRAIAINSMIYNSGEFYTPLNVPTSVPAQDSIVTRIYFKPFSYGSVSDTLTINYDGGSEKISLVGNSPYPEIKANLNPVNFGETKTDSAVIKQILITNPSLNKLIIDSVKLGSKQFAYAMFPYPFTINSLDTLRLQVIFNPDSSSAFQDTLFIYNNSKTPVFKIPVWGDAVPSGTFENRPLEFYLYQNYPNPFNQSTVIKYSIAERQRVSINVYNIAGQLINKLFDGIQPAGNYSLKWNGDDFHGTTVGSGVYIYRIITEKFVRSRKMLLLK